MILFEQEAECAGVEPMINRKEWTISRTADVNDRFSDPALVADASIVEGTQPVVAESEGVRLALSFNGNIVNTSALKKEIDKEL